MIFYSYTSTYYFTRLDAPPIDRSIALALKE